MTPPPEERATDTHPWPSPISTLTQRNAAHEQTDVNTPETKSIQPRISAGLGVR